MSFDPMKVGLPASWRASFTGSPGLLEYLGREVGLSSAAVVARFLWPVFVEVDDCVLIAEFYDEPSFVEWKRRGLGSSRIEATVNHLHLWDVFDGDGDSGSVQSMAFLGQVVAKTWLAAAESAFPARRFLTRYTDDDIQDYGPTVAIWAEPETSAVEESTTSPSP